jgi:hypothetical protein
VFVQCDGINMIEKVQALRIYMCVCIHTELLEYFP